VSDNRSYFEVCHSRLGRVGAALASTTDVIVKFAFFQRPSGRPIAHRSSDSSTTGTNLMPGPRRKGSRLLLAVPKVPALPIDPAPNVNSNGSGGTIRSQHLSATCRIPLSPVESTIFQEGIRRLKLSLLSFAGGSVTWRLFLGGSVAVFIGALTLAWIGPTSQNVPVAKERNSRSIGSATVDAKASPIKQPEIELTVATNAQNAGQEAAEYDDPFVPENRVQPKYLHALHLATEESLAERATIRQVSSRRSIAPHPAKLAGTIEADDDSSPVKSSNPLRNHERSRPRDH
jgi:hypothetical protein